MPTLAALWKSARRLCDVGWINSERSAKGRRIDPARVLLRSRVNELSAENRSQAGSRTIVGMLRDNGFEAGRFEVRGLMQGSAARSPSCLH